MRNLRRLLTFKTWALLLGLALTNAKYQTIENPVQECCEFLKPEIRFLPGKVAVCEGDEGSTLAIYTGGSATWSQVKPKFTLSDPPNVLLLPIDPGPSDQTRIAVRVGSELKESSRIFSVNVRADPVDPELKPASRSFWFDIKKRRIEFLNGTSSPMKTPNIEVSLGAPKLMRKLQVFCENDLDPGPWTFTIRRVSQQSEVDGWSRSAGPEFGSLPLSVIPNSLGEIAVNLTGLTWVGCPAERRICRARIYYEVTALADDPVRKATGRFSVSANFGPSRGF